MRSFRRSPAAPNEDLIAIMQGPGCIAIALLLLLVTAACTTSSLPTLPASEPQATQAGKADASQPPEVASIVPGSATDIYALVARGALRCWFGADGPLKPTHVFHAEAESPVKGGAAEMVIHERDETMRDKRGPRALRVSFSNTPGGVRVAVSVLKMDEQLGKLMAKDVAAWSRGGIDCEVRRQMAPPQPVTPVVGKGATSAVKR